MTDIDPRRDIRTVYSDDDLVVVIPLAGADAARSLMAETDAVEQSPASSNSPEAIARRWCDRQQEA